MSLSSNTASPTSLPHSYALELVQYPADLRMFSRWSYPLFSCSECRSCSVILGPKYVYCSVDVCCSLNFLHVIAYCNSKPIMILCCDYPLEPNNVVVNVHLHLTYQWIIMVSVITCLDTVFAHQTALLYWCLLMTFGSVCVAPSAAASRNLPVQYKIHTTVEELMVL